MLDLGDRVSIYQPEQKGLIFPERPSFDNLEEEREYRKRHLVAACRAFALEGFYYGFAGHLTVRDPQTPELYWTNPMCIHFADVKMSNLILVDHEGTVIEGHHAVNRAGFILHANVHDKHPDIVAMCHAHTVYGTAWCATGRPIDPITQDACAFFEDHVVIGEQGGQVAVENSAGSDVAQAFAGVKAALHQNHGLLTASRHSIDAAAFWFIALERCCKQQLDIAAAGIAPIHIPTQRARYSREHVGSEYIGWLHFQTIWNRLLESQGDMFE